VGAGTALFSVVKAVLLNPLPYSDPSRIAWLAETNDAGKPTQVAYANFADWREQNRSFSGMAAFSFGSTNLAGGAAPQTVRAGIVTEDFLHVMGARPVVGRAFSHEENTVGGPHSAILGYGLWQRAFGSDPGVIGRAVRIPGLALTVVGVMPRGFDYPENAELWIPAAALGDPGVTVRTGHNYQVIARLKPGVSIEAAQSDIRAI